MLFTVPAWVQVLNSGLRVLALGNLPPLLDLRHIVLGLLGSREVANMDSVLSLLALQTFYDPVVLVVQVTKGAKRSLIGYS